MDCSVYKQCKHTVAHGTLSNSSSYNTLALSQKKFYLILQLGMAYAMMGRESRDSTLLHEFTGSHTAYGTHTWPHPFWVK